MLPAIKEFIKTSMVDKVVYHGTLRSFKEFYKSNGFGCARYRTEGGRITGNRQMFYFTDDVNVAAGYAGKCNRNSQSGPNIIPVYLNLKNPLVIDAEGCSWRVTLDKILEAYDNKTHDGSIILNSDDTMKWQSEISNVYVAFSNTQILSAICGQGFWSEQENLAMAA